MPVFFRRRRPWPMQSAIISELVRGRDALLCAPTASGKTEAAIAGLYQRHVSFRRPSLSVVWVAPTRALVNDIYARLSEHVAERAPDVIRRYTGDRHEIGKVESCFALVATPEALDSLQLTRPELLARIRAVVIDEAHLLHGTARGQQLRHVIGRIRARSRIPSDERDRFQQIAMTATLRHASLVRDAWLAREAKIFEFQGTRQIQFECLTIDGSNKSPRAQREADAIARWLSETGTRKVLIFGNSRNRTHSLALALHDRLSGSRWPLYLHIGILSRAQRETVEASMKAKAYGVCVATSTLEVGIDIGDIDAVLLADVPTSVNSFLQRVGRGNRRSETCHVLGLDSEPGSAELYAALLDCARNGELDDWHDYDRAAVRFQQVLSMAWMAARSGIRLTPRKIEMLCGNGDHEAVIRDMLSVGHLRNIRGTLIPSDALMDEGDARRIHSVIAADRNTRVVDVKTGEEVALAGDTLEEGAVFFAGTKMQRVVGREGSGVYVTGVSSEKEPLAVLPSARGGFGGPSRNLMWAVARRRGYDPKKWIRKDRKLLTWGGTTFNLLIASVLEENSIARNVASDEYAIHLDIALTPEKVEALLRESQARNALPLSIARKFHEPTRYFRRLSSDVQAAELRASVPYQSAMRWLRECRSADTEPV